MRKRNSVDRIFLGLVLVLLGFGAIIYASASLGLLARGTVSVPSVILNHALFGLCGGLIALIIGSRVHYSTWKVAAPYLYGLALAVTALVFVPGLGLHAGGATRWVLIGPISFQPSESLKIGVVLLFAALLAHYHRLSGSWRYDIALPAAVLALPATLLLLQPDTGTLLVVAASVGTMLITAGARTRHLVLMAIVGFLALAVLIITRPYALERITTFLHPEDSPTGAGYQIKQSLIAIGSGELAGRGFGQSVQKFSYLPEPMTDSIFAVAAEEFGFLGATTLVLLFLALAVRGFWIATRAPDFFGAVLGVGIVTYLAGQAFLNIGAMVGILPLTGIPLVFVSHGGTAMLIALGSVGILLNISRYSRTASAKMG